jgi:hypothetical protein
MCAFVNVDNVNVDVSVDESVKKKNEWAVRRRVG